MGCFHRWFHASGTSRLKIAGDGGGGGSHFATLHLNFLQSINFFIGCIRDYVYIFFFKSNTMKTSHNLILFYTSITIELLLLLLSINICINDNTTHNSNTNNTNN